MVEAAKLIYMTELTSLTSFPGKRKYIACIEIYQKKKKELESIIRIWRFIWADK